MVSIDQIQSFADSVGREFKPERIVLFGSYAYGTPKPDSDVDLLIVMEHSGRAWESAATIRARVAPTFPLDLLVRSPAMLRDRVNMGDPFLTEIVQRGKVIYEADYSRMGEQS